MQYSFNVIKSQISEIQGGSKKVSCWHSTTAYFVETWLKCCRLHQISRMLSRTNFYLIHALLFGPMNRAEAERIFCNLYIFGLYGAIYLKW